HYKITDMGEYLIKNFKNTNIKICGIPEWPSKKFNKNFCVGKLEFNRMIKNLKKQNVGYISLENIMLDELFDKGGKYFNSKGLQ
ncbi:hypothetical protein, partial [Campylobacter jejuni]|uniref:hypothetical protein n=1 Tax=Campylobacter jejuni TaxID=197 RepID=UPI001E37C7C1